MNTISNIEITNLFLTLIFLVIFYFIYFLVISVNYFTKKELLKEIKKENFLLREENEKLLKLKKPINLNILTKEQEKRFNTWKNNHKPLPYIGANGGHFGIDIKFTSVGYILIAYNWKGDEIDLTEYEKF